MSRIYIYKITSPTNKIYIGQTWEWWKRKSSYKTIKCKRQKKLYNSLKKYGFEAHKIEILIVFNETISQKSLDFYEIYWWKHYKDLGFNMLNIKEPGSYGKHSEETKIKIREKRAKQIITEEHKRNISKGSQGKKRSNEFRLKMSKVSIGKPKSLNHIRNSSVSRTIKVKEVMENGTEKIWNGTIEIAKHYKMTREAIYARIKNTNKKSKKLKSKFYYIN